MIHPAIQKKVFMAGVLRAVSGYATTGKNFIENQVTEFADWTHSNLAPWYPDNALLNPDQSSTYNAVSFANENDPVNLAKKQRLQRSGALLKITTIALPLIDQAVTIVLAYLMPWNMRIVLGIGISLDIAHHVFERAKSETNLGKPVQLASFVAEYEKTPGWLSSIASKFTWSPKLPVTARIEKRIEEINNNYPNFSTVLKVGSWSANFLLVYLAPWRFAVAQLTTMASKVSTQFEYALQAGRFRDNADQPTGTVDGMQTHNDLPELFSTSIVAPFISAFVTTKPDLANKVQDYTFQWLANAWFPGFGQLNDQNS